MLQVDDWMRRQLRIYKSERSGFFGNHRFGVPGHSTINYTWALFPTLTTDYYDFINAARRETVPVYKVEGAGGWVPYDIALGWSTAALTALLDSLAIKTAILCGPLPTGGAPWLGNDGYCNEQNFSLADELHSLGAACRRLKSIQPQLACLAPFETALSPCQLVQPDGKAPPPAWPDSVVITRNGTPSGYDWNYPTPPTTGARNGKIALNYIYTPHTGNSYGQWLEGLLKQALAVGMDGL